MTDIPTIEITQAIVTRDERPVGIFILFADIPNERQRERVMEAWDWAWRDVRPAPRVICLPRDWAITELNDAELRKVGLMRIPAVE